MGSIMIEENVVSAAGADNEANESDLRYQIREAGFIPQQRDILYNYIYRDGIDDLDAPKSMPLKKLSVALPSGLPVGLYTVRWKTLSADDGDSAEGTLTFTYDPSKPPDPGRTTLKEDLLSPPGAGQSAPTALGGTDSGRSWVLVVAVAIAAFALGGGGTFLLVQKRP